VGREPNGATVCCPLRPGSSLESVYSNRSPTGWPLGASIKLPSTDPNPTNKSQTQSTHAGT